MIEAADDDVGLERGAVVELVADRLRFAIEIGAARERERVDVLVVEADRILRGVRTGREIVEELERLVRRPDRMLLVVVERIDDVLPDRGRERGALLVERLLVARAVVVLGQVIVCGEVAVAEHFREHGIRKLHLETRCRKMVLGLGIFAARELYLRTELKIAVIDVRQDLKLGDPVVPERIRGIVRLVVHEVVVGELGREVRIGIDMEGVARYARAQESRIGQTDLLLDVLTERKRVDETDAERIGNRPLHLALELDVFRADVAGLVNDGARDIDRGRDRQVGAKVALVLHAELAAQPLAKRLHVVDRKVREPRILRTIVDRVGIDRRIPVAVFGADVRGVSQAESTLGVILDAIIPVVRVGRPEADPQFHPESLGLVVTDQRKKTHLAPRIRDVEQRNDEQRYIEDCRRPQKHGRLMRHEFVARRDVDLPRFHVVARMRVLTGRKVAVLAVRDAGAAGDERIRFEVQFALRHAFDRFAFPLDQRRLARMRIEQDLIRVQNRILTPVDQIRMPRHRDRMLAVVVRHVADDLSLGIKNMNVADEIGGASFVARQP